jgi:hypothetical protein
MKLLHILIINFPVHKHGHDVLKFLGEDGLQLMMQLINSIHETTEWPSDFTAVTVIALKKKSEATKCSDHCIISLLHI